MPEAICCEDDKCTAASDAAFTCSNTFTDKEYALTMCPQKQEKCGTKQDVEFETIGSVEDLTVTGLEAGESCTFKIKSKKGAPAFRMKKDSTITNDKVEITFIEYEETEEVTLTVDGKPTKDQFYADSGSQGTEEKPYG